MASSDLLNADTVKLGVAATDREDAIRQAGEILLEIGAIEKPYVEAMYEREQIMSSYMGEGFAIPHGTNESRQYVKRAAVAFLQFSEPVDWEGDDAAVALAIASNSDEHTAVLAALAQILSDPEKAETLRTTDDPEVVISLLASKVEEERE